MVPRVSSSLAAELLLPTVADTAVASRRRVSIDEATAAVAPIGFLDAQLNAQRAQNNELQEQPWQGEWDDGFAATEATYAPQLDAAFARAEAAERLLAELKL